MGLLGILIQYSLQSNTEPSIPCYAMSTADGSTCNIMTFYRLKEKKPKCLICKLLNLVKSEIQIFTYFSIGILSDVLINLTLLKP